MLLWIHLAVTIFVNFFASDACCWYFLNKAKEKKTPAFWNVKQSVKLKKLSYPPFPKCIPYAKATPWLRATVVTVVISLCQSNYCEPSIRPGCSAGAVPHRESSPGVAWPARSGHLCGGDRAGLGARVAVKSLGTRSHHAGVGFTGDMSVSSAQIPTRSWGWVLRRTIKCQ